MSGGHFELICYKFSQFADDLECEILNNEVENDFNYCPNFSDATISKIKEVQVLARKLADLSKEVEWLYSSDISEENFMDRVNKIESGLVDK